MREKKIERAPEDPKRNRWRRLGTKMESEGEGKPEKCQGV
jgi:hypothetical protein